ncbi:adenosylcobinamide-phosphate synthase CbiB [Marinomonas sp. MED121]|uniref:adenosylcobinamide-phosphate synthase CbiB n=1 Tax=Marinomonas sp. MED121 TaxID=314277 RepID=UPI0002D82688|nr:adenosylcobinamide-phosphate synthase CbiB [Marinomonas sp. MED121]
MTETFFASTIILLLALIMDRVLGEPKSWHPLITFGRWVDQCQAWCQLPLSWSAFSQRLFGVFAWLLAVVPLLLLWELLESLLPTLILNALAVVIVYFSIGWQSLREHGLAIANPLLKGDLIQARIAVSYIVSRDTDSLNEEQVAKAGIESVLENGSDAVFAPIFWFLILGVPGAILYRLANTLDAMWGYKTNKWLHFGWCAARVDDVLNYLPAKLVVFSYALCGQYSNAMQAARAPEASWKSPNAGPVMAAGAASLGLAVGGEAVYFGKTESRPVLGKGEVPQAKDLVRSITLVDKTLYLWFLSVAFIALF